MRLVQTIGSCLIAALVLPAATAEETRPPETPGLRCVGSACFPVPEGTTAIPLVGGDFEDGKPSPGWALGGGKFVEAADSPQGKHYYQFPARKGTIVLTPRDTKGLPGRPHFFSFWLKCPEDHWACVGFGSDEKLRTFGDHYPGIPATGDQWKRVGYYVWMPPQCRTIHFQIQPHKDSPEGQTIAVDDFRLRTATEAEMSAAYEAERKKLPPYDASPRPGDGRNLALSVAKWQGRAGVPGRPFVIWAVGSSWTNFQGDGYPLVRAIRERFPNAPPIVYRKHAGSGTPWDFARGWVRQFVIADQPDLVFTYTNGSPEGLDALLAEVRRHTTADVLVPSLHFFQNSPMNEQDVERGVVDWPKVREICREHGAEFVENRRELARYMSEHGLEPSQLVGDPVHQNQHGFIRIWDNITRHAAAADKPAYDPRERERRVAVAPPAQTETEKVAVSAGWKAQDGVARTSQKGATITVRFTGNRIDLLGRRLPGGGRVRVRIDGRPGGEAPAFYTTYIEPKPKQWPLKLQGPGPGDIAPHAVELGANVVPQTWTITMTSESGDFKIEGSVTGPDGEGKSDQPFTSKSGQVRIDLALWRHNKRGDKDGRADYNNRAGDAFSFDVYRSATGEIGFAAEQEGAFAAPLAQNLPNGPHVVEIEAAGDGEVAVEGFYVFQPPYPRHGS